MTPDTFLRTMAHSMTPDAIDALAATPEHRGTPDMRYSHAVNSLINRGLVDRADMALTRDGVRMLELLREGGDGTERT